MPTDPCLAISELFFSIQGESTHAGLPCLFIRLAGCNLRCTYCDAQYTYREESRVMALTEIMAFVAGYPGAMVEITGGEPLLQEAVYPLLAELLAQDRLVLLETNGSLDLSRVPAAVVKVMDLKCPGSGMAEEMLLANLAQLSPGDELKCVLCSRADYEWAVAILRRHNLLRPPTAPRSGPAILFSPVVSQLPAADLAAWLLADNLPVRLQLQLHTLLWPTQKRGV